MSISVRPATATDVRHFYGDCSAHMRMVVVEQAGEVVGIGGLVWLDDGCVVVSWFLSPATPKAIARTAHVVQAMMEEVGGVFHAHPDPDHSTADAFLLHLGFGKEDGRYVYRAERACEAPTS